MKKSLSLGLGLGTVLLPFVAYAQNTSYIDFWIKAAKGWLGTAVTVIMVVMTLYFLISVFRYISNKDASKVAEKRGLVIQGLVGLFFAVGVWGIIRLATGVFGVNTNTTPNLQCPPGSVYDYSTGGCRII